MYGYKIPPGTQVSSMFALWHPWAVAVIWKVARWLLHLQMPCVQSGKEEWRERHWVSPSLVSTFLSGEQQLLGKPHPVDICLHSTGQNWVTCTLPVRESGEVFLIGHIADLNNNRLLAVEKYGKLVGSYQYLVKKLRQCLSLCLQIWSVKRCLGFILYNFWETCRTV